MRDGINVILVGMPGAGKSTVGVILAKRISRGFVDTD
ncbi:MAG: shikimate kinase, partial [Thermodesulfobacteriota bacterium]